MASLGISATAGGIGSEIEEEIEEATTSEPHPGVSASLGTVAGGDDVYVAVGKGSTSMDALSWALKHVATPTSFVYLVHVFPEVHHIPTPLGMMPKSQLSKEQVEIYMNQERTKRREMLQKFIKLCQKSKVQVDTILIESDQIVKAVVDLIGVLNIKRLTVGTAKSSIRKLMKGSSKAEQIHRNAPHYCEIKVICDGKEIKPTDQLPSPASLSPRTPSRSDVTMNTKDSGHSPRRTPPPSDTTEIREKDGEHSPRSKAICLCF